MNKKRVTEILHGTVFSTLPVSVQRIGKPNSKGAHALKIILNSPYEVQNIVKSRS